MEELLPNVKILWSMTDGSKISFSRLDGIRLPDMMLVDMSLESMSGIAVCRRIRRRNSTTKLLAMTSFAIGCYGNDAADAGAQGIVNKNDEQDLLSGIREVSNGKTYGNYAFESAHIAHCRIRNSSANIFDIISNRELQVMDLMSGGMSDTDISLHLDIKEATVRKHIQSAIQKLNVETRIQAVIKWTKRG